MDRSSGRFSSLSIARLALGGLLLAAFLALGLTQAPQADAAKVSVSISTKNQTELLKAGGIQVVVKSKARTKVTVSASGKGKSSYFGTRKETVRGQKRILLPLTSAGLSALAYCGPVPVEARAGSSRTSRVLPGGSCTEVELGENPTRCDFLDPTVCLQPFANDYFTRTDRKTPTGKRLNLWEGGTPANIRDERLDTTDMNRADGFSPGNLITLKIPGMDTPAAFSNSGIVPISDIAQYADPDQAVMVINTRTGKRHPIWAEIDSNPTAVDPSQAGPGGIDQDPTNTEGVNLIIRPAKNFDHSTRYVVVLRNLKDSSNAPIPAPDTFRVYRDWLPTEEELIEQRRPSMESAIQTAVNQGKVKRSDLYMAWDFTVASRQSVTGRAVAIRDDAFKRLGDTNLANRKIEGSAPQFTINPQGERDFTADPVEDVSGIRNNPNTDVLRQVNGRITVPCYLNSDNCDPGGVFEFNSKDELIWTSGKTATFRFRCDIPSTASAANPTSTMTYGHGLLGRLYQVSSGYQRALAPLANTTQCAVDWAGFSELDLSSVGASLADMSNFPKLADRMQQGFVNFLYLQRALIHPQGFAAHPAFQDGDGTTPGQSLIDVSRGVNTRGQFMGISQGGIMGGALMALSPDADYGVLGVPGMNYSTLLRRSVDSDEYFKAPVIGLYRNYPDFDDRMLLLSLVQLLWDRGEANGYAHFMTDKPLPNTPPHEVLMRVAFSDHQVANITAEVEARTIGAKMYDPALQPGRHWSANPYFGLQRASQFPWRNGSILVYYDSGGVNFTGKRGIGVLTPPDQNVPPRPQWGFGRDPHGDPRVSQAGMTHAIEFLNGPNLDGQNRGTVRDCLSITGLGGDLAPGIPDRSPGDRHCYANGWNGITGGN